MNANEIKEQITGVVEIKNAQPWGSANLMVTAVKGIDAQGKLIEELLPFGSNKAFLLTLLPVVNIEEIGAFVEVTQAMSPKHRCKAWAKALIGTKLRIRAEVSKGTILHDRIMGRYANSDQNGRFLVGEFYNPIYFSQEKQDEMQQQSSGITSADNDDYFTNF